MVNSINDLFCTPDQGKRLKELVPESTSVCYWQSVQMEGMSRPEWVLLLRQKRDTIPALTLQELRAIAQSHDLHRLFRMKGADRIESWSDVVTHSTAPELAQWVIDRLEESK